MALTFFFSYLHWSNGTFLVFDSSKNTLGDFFKTFFKNIFYSLIGYITLLKLTRVLTGVFRES